MADQKLSLARGWLCRTLVTVLAVLLVFFAGCAAYLVGRFSADRPVDYEDNVEHFKYGSTGGERASGFPYWIFQAMPRVCAHYLPGESYRSLGFVFDDKKDDRKDLPIGMSKRRHLGLDRTFLNCAVCHTGTVRDSPQAERRIYLGMPANTFDLGSFQKFLFDCARDSKFSTEYVVPEIDHLMREKGQRLGLLDRYVVYPIAIAIMRDRLLMLRGRMEPLLEQTAWGPGRVDTFNPNKTLFNFPLAELPEREKNAPSDFPSIWLQKPRQGMQLHWDGNNVMAEERNKNAAFGTGTTPPTIDLAAIGRLEEWLLKKEPDAYPYGTDAAKVARGEKVYKKYCANCHGASGRDFGPPKGDTSRECIKSGERDDDLYGPYVGKITRIEEIGTDPHRLDSFSYDLAVHLGTVYAGYPHRYCHYRKTFGYANMPLDGVWLRAPYLHNGSVPTLRDLLKPVAQRPKAFYRGYDVFDPINVGFVSNVAEEKGRRYFLYDTTKPGNSNKGHDGPAYGTHLPDDDKDAVVEYLKKF